MIALKIKLIEAAEVIRSKNSGPFELTLDIIFKDWEVFNNVCKKGTFNKSIFADVYKIPLEDVISVIEFKPAKAIKATIKRPLASGDLGDRDIYGAQQHAPLLGIEFEI